MRKPLYAGFSTGNLLIVIVLLAVAALGYFLLRPDPAAEEARVFDEHCTPVTVEERILRTVMVEGQTSGATAAMLLETEHYFIGLSPPPPEGLGEPMSDDQSVAVSMIRGSATGTLRGYLVAPYEGLSWIRDGMDLQEADGVLCYRGKPFVLLDRSLGGN